jgi:hypothetical protein
MWMDVSKVMKEMYEESARELKKRQFFGHFSTLQ